MVFEGFFFDLAASVKAKSQSWSDELGLFELFVFDEKAEKDNRNPKRGQND